MRHSDQAAALPPALADVAAARGAQVFLGYGVSETCPVLTIDRFRAGDAPDTARTAAGRPIAWVTLALRLEARSRPKDRNGAAGNA